MLVHEILEEVGRWGVSLFPKGDRIRFYPKNALTPELLEELKAHKAEILVVLSEEPVRSASEILEMARKDLGPSRSVDPDEHSHPRRALWVDEDKEALFFSYRHTRGGGAA
jgi:hypothetical protein